MSKVPDCNYCGAMRFQYETPEFCRRKGKVQIHIPEVPAELTVGNTPWTSPTADPSAASPRPRGPRPCRHWPPPRPPWCRPLGARTVSSPAPRTSRSRRLSQRRRPPTPRVPASLPSLPPPPATARCLASRSHSAGRTPGSTGPDVPPDRVVSRCASTWKPSPVLKLTAAGWSGVLRWSVGKTRSVFK